MNEVEGTLFQAGAYFERNYLQIRGNNINQYGVTAGISLPNNSHVLRYNISVEVGERGVAVYPLVKEKFFKLGVAMSFRGLMMNPRVRYYD